MSTSKKEEIIHELVRIIRSEREAKGLNYEDMAGASGLHRTSLGLYERGERCPTVEAALQIANALDTPLSHLLKMAEDSVFGNGLAESYVHRRTVAVENLRNGRQLRELAGLPLESVRSAILNCYKTLDTIDQQLTAHGAEPMARLVELANLSSMIGNLLGAGLAAASNGLYKRNRPHTYPDLIPQTTELDDFEIKVALEKNKPKGHLPKAGNYITFRYVLCDDLGNFTSGKENRGTRVFIWEVKVGAITIDDFSISNTSGDSGKTAVIKTDIFNKMPLVYYDRELLPYSQRNEGRYPGFN